MDSTKEQCSALDLTSKAGKCAGPNGEIATPGHSQKSGRTIFQQLVSLSASLLSSPPFFPKFISPILLTVFAFLIIKPAGKLSKIVFLYSFQSRADTARHLRELAPGVVKVLPEGQIRMGPVGAAAVRIALTKLKQNGTTLTYFPASDLFVVVRKQE